jgi:outer membrane protein assembly factor BamB
MPRDPQILIYIGIKDSVLALDEKTGAELWRAKLRTNDYVTVSWDGEALIAANSGEVWRLDPVRGEVIWHNELKGMGRGLVSIASSRYPNSSRDAVLAAEKRRRDAASSSAAAATA